MARPFPHKSNQRKYLFLPGGDGEGEAPEN